jgi:hypothetical protein
MCSPRRSTAHCGESFPAVVQAGDDVIARKPAPSRPSAGALTRRTLSPATRGELVIGSSLPRAVSVWCLGLLVFIPLAAGCTSTVPESSSQGRESAQGQESSPGHKPWEGHGPNEGPGPNEGQGPSGGRGHGESQGSSGDREPNEGKGPSGGRGHGEHDFVTLPVGARLPSGQECAARVQRDQQEPRPENTAANQFVPDRVTMPVWKDFTEQANQQFVSRIDGKFTGTTEEILTWGACKWGLDADVLKAVAVQESDWRQSTVSDQSNNPQECVGGATPPCPTSFGIMQLKHTALPGSFPLSRQSTAFNVDYYGARIRACYEGWVTYLHDDYHPGDLRDCVGWHWSGHWKDDGAQRYIQRVDHYLDSKPWLHWTNEQR